MPAQRKWGQTPGKLLQFLTESDPILGMIIYMLSSNHHSC